MSPLSPHELFLDPRHPGNGALSFLTLPVIPELRITDRGLFDVVRQEFVQL